MISTTNTMNNNITITTTTTTTTTNPNLFRIADENELEQNEKAVILIRKIYNEDVSRTNPIYSREFKPQTSIKQVIKLDNLIKQFIGILGLLENKQTLSMKSQVKNLKKRYNTCLNLLLAVVSEGSQLQKLLPIDDNLRYNRKRVPVQRTRIDFINQFLGGTVGHGKFILHTKGPSNIGGGRTEFDSAEECLSAMRGSIEQSVVWSDLIIYPENVPSYGICKFKISEEEQLYAGLKIKFQGTRYWESSDSTRLKHILCEGTPPQKSTIAYDDQVFSRMYPHYVEFLHLVRAQIIQIIKNSHSEPECKYTYIPCCNTYNVCNGNTLCVKHGVSMSKLVTCGECKLDLCIGGCGRVYHGETPCDILLDEASELVIQGTSKRCPNDRCKVPIHKYEGCNHMSCPLCKTQFCYICGDELPKDSRGHYVTFMHFRPAAEGYVGIVGGCNQFDVPM
jgi:hypothetical protein